MRTLPNKIRIKVTKSHKKKAGEYVDNHDCLFCTSIKSALKGAKVYVEPQMAKINNVKYSFSKTNEKRIHACYYSTRIRYPFFVTLTKCEL